jgi:hypothetical protein
MGIYVTEHPSDPNYRQPATKALTIGYYLTSTVQAVGPLPQAGTKFIRVSADAGMLLNLSTTSTGLTLTSTNSFRVPVNVSPEIFAIVSTTFRVQSAST